MFYALAKDKDNALRLLKAWADAMTAPGDKERYHPRRVQILLDMDDVLGAKAYLDKTEPQLQFQHNKNAARHLRKRIDDALRKPQ